MIGAGLALLLGAFAGTFAVGMVVSGFSNAQIMARLNRLESRIFAMAGNEVKSEKAARMSAAMAEAMLIMKDESIPKEDKTKALLGLAGKFPDVAFDLVKKVGINGLL